MTVASTVEPTEEKSKDGKDLYLHDFSKEEFLNDLEYLADKALKYARSKSSINTHQKINQIRSRYGLDRRLL